MINKKLGFSILVGTLVVSLVAVVEPTNLTR